MNLKHTTLALITFFMSSAAFCQVNILEVDGVIKIANIDTLTPAEGTLRFNSNTKIFEGWNGLYWVQLGKALKEISDIDGNTYRTVQIGSQEWMAENLKVKRFNSGNEIPQIVDGTTWKETVNAAWCYYQNDPSMNEIHGKLYNFFAIEHSENLCPVGWRVPDVNEWNMLRTFLLGKEAAGGKLKASSAGNWSNPNVGATNESGFTGVASGYRNIATSVFGSSLFLNVGTRAFYWTSDDNNRPPESSGLIRTLSFVNTHLGENKFPKNYGLSVRCIK